MRYVNTISQIEARAGMDVEELRTRYGEARLKMVETEVMSDLLLYRGAVLRVNGETLMRGEFIKRLQENGIVICLVVTLDAVLTRLHQVLGGRYHNPQERALAIGTLKREWAVRKLPDVHELDVTNLTETEIAEAVQNFWQQLVLNAS